MRRLRIGSRASRLAMAQTGEVMERLRASCPSLELQVVGLRTKGDALPEAHLAGMGRGIFVKELEESLLKGDIDLAVHSLKDLPTLLPDGLAIVAVCPRADPFDVLINRWGCSLEQLPTGARIGTSSPRRAAQIKDRRKDLEVLPMRGNVETRLGKTRGTEYDGAILAAAGIERLAMGSEVAERLSPQEFVPAPGQGALAVEARTDNATVAGIVACLEHTPTRQAVSAERRLLELLGGGCQLPMGAYAWLDDGLLELTAFLASEDGNESFRSTARAASGDSGEEVAARCRQGLIEAGASWLERHNA